MRLATKLASGDLSWRCSIHSCSGRLHTDSGATRIINFGGPHNHLTKEQRRQRKAMIAAKGKKMPVAVPEPAYIIDDYYKIKRKGVSTCTSPACSGDRSG